MADTRQLALDLPSRPALGREDFFVAPANQLAVLQIDDWPRWVGGRLALVGPKGAGKTHLTHVWAQRASARILKPEDLDGLDPLDFPGDGAVAVEDTDRLAHLADRAAAEEALFHLHNHLGAGGGRLLVTGRSAPAQWDIALPDLASRLGAIGVARLEAPDDALLAAVLVKLFADRQIQVAPDLIAYVLARMDRSFEAAEELVSRLDHAGLARRRPVTARLASEILREQPD